VYPVVPPDKMYEELVDGEDWYTLMEKFVEDAEKKIQEIMQI